MRICLLGDTTGYLDEGMKNSTFSFFSELKKLEDVILVRPKSVLNPKTLQEIRTFRPNIIHYTMGPTLRSFAIVRALSCVAPGSTVVMSSPRPRISVEQTKLLFGYRPHLLLTQSSRQVAEFSAMGFRTLFFPPGVSLDRFCPVSHITKRKLREKYRIPPHEKVLLHVGHIDAVRELHKLIPVQKTKAFYTLIVAAGTISPDPSIVAFLRLSGCDVRIGFLQKIEEFYQLSDVYCFPGTGPSSAIEIPLSVLEAMSCNLPVITGRFGGLPDLFREGNGLYFADSETDIMNRLHDFQSLTPDTTKSRKTVEQLSWTALADRLIEIYSALMDGKRERLNALNFNLI